MIDIRGDILMVKRAINYLLKEVIDFFLKSQNWSKSIKIRSKTPKI
jgi:hypothetical protein